MRRARIRTPLIIDSPRSPIKPLFIKTSSAAAKLVLLVLLSLLLIVAGRQFGWMQSLKAQLSALAMPFYQVADIPAKIGDWSDDRIAQRSTLVEQNQRYQSEILLLKAQVQKLAALEAENVRLRELLNSSAILDDSVLVAEIISVSPNPQQHQIVINKGTADGLYIGQPVIDALGLTGQVVEVGPLQSRVLLLTDTSHALPVQVLRNGVRAVAEGVGRLDQLVLQHVAATTDIQTGDILISSGLGQRFPSGYPVGIVNTVQVADGQAFATVTARPSAALDRSGHVLLVFSQARAQPEAAASPDSLAPAAETAVPAETADAQ